MTANSILLIMLSALFYSSIYAAQFQLHKFSNLAQQRYGDEAYQLVLTLNQILNSLKLANDIQKLESINHFFNQHITFVEDIELWKQSDYWATPLETLGMRVGDCEDYSIAKYMFLKVLGVPNEKLRLTYVRAQIDVDGTKKAVAHMVLSYYPQPNADPIILDNLNPTLLPASKRPDLVPIFSFNDKELWVGSNTQPKTNSQHHLSKWRDVLLRSRADGIE